MKDIPHLKMKLEKNNLVWFENSDLYFQMEEPAWLVFEKLNAATPFGKIAEEFSEIYDISFDESMTFVKDMHARIDEMNQPLEYDPELDRVMEQADGFDFVPYSVYTYQLGDKYIKFSYGTSWLEDYIHPLMEHLSVEAGEQDICFELSSHEDKVILEFDGEVKGVWYNDESAYVKGAIFFQLINRLHGKTNEDWLMTVHASAVTNGKKTILFSAEPGSGKTTMAALLQAKGYHLISDDYVPFDKYSGNAYPFPAAMSVKEGAVLLLTDFYPELKAKESVYINPEKTVRYLPILNEKMGMVYPANEIVFIKYSDGADFSFEKMDLADAVKLYLEQIWVPPKAENVKLFFKQLKNLSFYKLTYSDYKDALKAITKLFEDE